jgi:beta-phosphoglucomutase
MAASDQRGAFAGAIFDVDGVLVDSPHERAWAESLRRLMEGSWRDLAPRTSYRPERFSHDFYQEVMAGKPRVAGAQAALEAFGVPDAKAAAKEYGEDKQARVAELIDAGEFHAYPDAIRFFLATKQAGLRVATASSSRNARPMLQRISLDRLAGQLGLDLPAPLRGRSLIEAVDADLSGRSFLRGKPDPMIFLTAAEELGVRPADSFVVEDAQSGIKAAKAGGMAGLGVARQGGEELLREAGAELVVQSLDEVDLDAVREGRLARK